MQIPLRNARAGFAHACRMAKHHGDRLGLTDILRSMKRAAAEGEATQHRDELLRCIASARGPRQSYRTYRVWLAYWITTKGKGQRRSLPRPDAPADFTLPGE